MIKIIKLILTCHFFLVSPFIFASATEMTNHSLKVNVISQNLYNGKGKENDALIIKLELEKLGHQVQILDYLNADKSTADINIFLAQFSLEWFPYAKLNWFIPNAEYYLQPVEDLLKFDLVLCKTLESQKIFRPLSKITFFLGFTSLDRLDPLIPKDFKHCFHLAGGSQMKGTHKVIQAWNLYPELPYLNIVTFNYQPNIFPANVNIIAERVSNEKLLLLLNNSGIHICPSKTEGFGHYIMEGMSTGAVVVTTDAPPMNEFIKDKRCLVNYKSIKKKELARTFIVDIKDLADKVTRLQQLPYETLQNIGQQNRKEYLRKKEQFQHNFQMLMNEAEQMIQNKKNN